ncbi:MAG: hypothetical protein HFH68_02285 [Lachnospiraceae bacterium]|nr:hypothetical protein [Lachnospiraceae bacterium]
MNNKKHFKTTAIFLCIIPLLSCILCSTSSKAFAYTENWFNPYLKLAAPQKASVPETPAITEAPPVITFDTVVTTSSAITSTANDITITWDAVTDAEGYELSISYNGISYTTETTANSFVIPSLSAATICSYQIRCYKTILGEKIYSPMSETFYAATTVNKVTGIAVTDRAAQTATSASISLIWDNMNNASYKVYYKPVSEGVYKLSGNTSLNAYTIEGLTASERYDIYIQAYCLNENNTGEISDVLSLYTCPAAVSGFKIVTEESHRVDLSWDENPTGSSYYLYRSINDLPYELYTVTTSTSISEIGLEAGTVYSYTISSYLDTTNLLSQYSEELRAVTTPYVTTGLALSANTADSIHLSWNLNDTATGYIIYRRQGSGDFEYLTSTTETSYTDTGLDSGKNYRYKIMTYADTEEHTSGFGDVEKTSTLPAQVNLKGKAGYGKLRLTWEAVTGAAGYYIYQQQEEDFTLIDTIEDSKTISKVYENLTAEETYSYKVYAYRMAFGQEFISEESAADVTPQVTRGTTTSPSYYKTKKELINSDAWKKTAIVKKHANYSKSYTIPGIRSTNVNGFESTSMCPQGLTFAKDYLLISAYDSYGEEQSVIYVLDKEFKDLLTVIVLPNQTHAGGITFDGENIWVTNGKKVCTIDFKEVDNAAQEYAMFHNVNFSAVYKLEKKASFLTWHKDQLWAGSFEYTKNGTLRSYKVEKNTSEEEGGTPLTLTEQSSVTIPPAVQGIAFTGKNMILSRAYGYTNELNIYKPSGTGTQNMKTGKIKKTVQMPALNEEIAVLGNYIYVNFESAIPGSQALNHMDRVLAIKLKPVLK